MEYLSYTLEELTRGWREEAGGYRCIFCNVFFDADEVFRRQEGCWLNARGQVKAHICDEHGGCLQGLFNHFEGQIGLTDRQREVMLALAQGKSDQEAAGALGISVSTLRHMRFTFREREQKALFYLAAGSLALHQEKEKGGPVPVHQGATMIDQRYEVTREEEEKILKTSFESFEPLRLTLFSPKEKRKIVVLRRIAECFEPGRQYQEKEVNEILRPIYDDFVLIRRYLIEYGFMKRTRDCRTYWRNTEQ